MGASEQKLQEQVLPWQVLANSTTFREAPDDDVL